MKPGTLSAEIEIEPFELPFIKLFLFFRVQYNRFSLINAQPFLTVLEPYVCPVSY